MQREALNGPKRPQIFPTILPSSSIITFFPPQMHDSDGLSLELIFHCFPTCASCSKLFPNHQSFNGWLFATSTIYWNSVLHLEVATMPSIILEEEQCMDVNTYSRRGWIWVHFSNLAIHLSSSQPKERLLPPRSLIKQERINNRCLRKGRLCLLKRKGSLRRKAKQ